MYSFSLNSCLFHWGVGNLCKSVSFLLLGADSSSVFEPWLGTALNSPLLHHFLNSLLWWPQWNRALGLNVLCLPVRSSQWTLLGIPLDVFPLWRKFPLRGCWACQAGFSDLPLLLQEVGAGCNRPFLVVPPKKGLSLALNNLRCTDPCPLPSQHIVASTLHSMQL